MKMLLGVLCLSFGAVFANEQLHRMEGELKHKIQERDRLNEEIAQLSEKHSRESSAVRVRDMKPKKRTIAGDRATRKAY